MSFFTILFAVNFLVMIYFGMRIYMLFGHFLPFILRFKIIYSLVILLTSQSFIIVRLVFSKLGLVAPAILSYVVYSLAGLYVITLTVLIILDILLLLLRILRRQHLFSMRRGKFAIVCIVAVIALYGYGIFSTMFTTNKYYTLSVNKNIPKTTRIVAVSDIHISNYTFNKRLTQLVDDINALKPDVVVFVGDIIDGEVRPYKDKNVAAMFKKIRSRHGVYGVLGNHEYYGGDVNNAIKLLRQSGINVLVDKPLYISNLNMTLVGRDDLQANSRKSKPRAKLSALTRNVSKASLVVVLDHQPQEFAEAVAARADVQLSGHTHNGQIFPGNLIVKAIYENPWGLLKKNTLNLIVSCGYGTWGPPIRLGSRAEIVVIDVKKGR